MLLSTLTSFTCFFISLVAANCPVLVNVRVETSSSTIFDGYVVTSGHDVNPVTGGKHFCDGTNNKTHPTRVPVATAALDDACAVGNFTWAGDWNATLEEYFVTQIAGLPTNNNEFWAIYSNYKISPLGGCQFQVKEFDEVLFALYPYQPENYPQAALYLSGPQEVLANISNAFRVTNGTNGKPIAEASVCGETTSDNGYVWLEFSKSGVERLTAEKFGAIRSNRLRVVVHSTPGPGRASMTPRRIKSL